MKQIKKLVPEINDLKKQFIEEFNPNRKPKVKIAPVSLMLLGDHTQYNDGILLSSALQLYAVAVIAENELNEKRIMINGSVQKNTSKKNKYSWIEKYLNVLIDNIEELEEKTFSFDLLLKAEFPEALGIGRYPAIGAAFLMAFNELYDLNYDNRTLVNLTQGSERQVVDKISNKGNHNAAFFNPSNSLVKTDLRKEQPEFIPFVANNYRVVITDTGVDIENPAEICAERINECEIGVKGLRLYIWGIKNLRDVDPDFLKKHYHMIPHIVYKRCNYTVEERFRVERAIELLRNKKLNELKHVFYESHTSLDTDYSLSSEEQNFIVETAQNIDGVIGSKMISCSPKRAVYHLVHKKNVEVFTELLTKLYKKKFGKKLAVYTLKFSDGAQFLI